MGSSASAVSNLPEGYTLEQPSNTPSQGVGGLPPGYTLEQPAQPVKSNPVDDASNTRQMLVAGMTGMPTPNMTAADRASFETGKAAGAVSVPVVAGATAGAELLPDLALHTMNGVKALGTWAGANPLKAYLLYNVLKEMIPGAKKAIGFIHGLPDGD